MKPLLKWKGGKGGELTVLKRLLPADHADRRYVEPFAGAAALFYDLEPDRAILGDVQQPLMDMYELLSSKDKQFKRDLDDLVRIRETVNQLAYDMEAEGKLIDLYRQVCAASPASKVEAVILIHEQVEVWPFKFDEFNKRTRARWKLDVLRSELTRSLAAKLMRTSRRLAAEGQTWPDHEITEQARSSLHAGLYMHLRDKVKSADRSQAAAQFLYEREFAYGGMFRYGPDGNFNVPYGGMSYDGKNFAGKVARLLDADHAKLLAHAQMRCGDFEQIMHDVEPTDFVFLDPPYDTTFSGYGDHEFGPADHRRLAQWLHHAPCPVLLVIGSSELIHELYEPGAPTALGPLQIVSYDTKYQHNIRSRYDRSARHLAVTNYWVDVDD